LTLRRRKWKDERGHVKLFDTLYYSVYRFGRSIGQPHFQAKACALIFVPLFFLLATLYFCYTLVFKFHWTIVPHRGIKPWVEGLMIVIWIIAHIIYVKKGRGQRVIADLEKSKSQNFYIFLGATFSVITLLLPVLIFFLWRAIL
jgi:hypothetical protein